MTQAFREQAPHDVADHLQLDVDVEPCHKHVEIGGDTLVPQRSLPLSHAERSRRLRNSNVEAQHARFRP